MHRIVSPIVSGNRVLPAILIVVCLTGCLKSTQPDKREIKKRLDLAEGAFWSGDHAVAIKIMDQLRPKIANNNGALGRYYYLMALHRGRTPALMGLYADSALALFGNAELAAKDPEGYYYATLAAGEHRMRIGKYVTALDLFDRAKKIRPQTSMCDDGTLDGTLGMIYYNQKNYRNAASYWQSCYKKQGSCDQNADPQTTFYNKQGTLNNVGVSYERSGMLDSAYHYYQLGLAYIKACQGDTLISLRSINAASSVLYDNLGSIYLKWGKLDSARYYLNRSLAMPDAETDGTRIPPLLKLAELDIITGNYDAAKRSFIHSRTLLSKYAEANQNSNAHWKRLYAYYLSSIGRTDSVYHYLDEYIRDQDTLDKNSSTLYRLNIQRELHGIQQQQSLNELSQRNKVKLSYIIAIGISALLSLVIVYQIYRSLKRTRNSHRAATLHNQQLQQTLTELERVNQNHVRIMRVMAHDLRNPLSGMLGLASVLQLQDELTDESKHMVQLMENTGTHAMNMINELLKSGLADENEEMEMEKRAIDLNELLQNSVELLQFKAQEKKQRIIFEPSPKPAVVFANQEKIWRAFNNLIGNAIKFSHTGGEIRVAIKCEDPTITVSIADQGVGIAETDKERIFEMFTPAKKVGTDGEHPFGLGLSISKRIISMHRGFIWLDSEVGVGTTFYVELPAKK